MSPRLRPSGAVRGRVPPAVRCSAHPPMLPSWGGARREEGHLCTAGLASPARAGSLAP